MKNRKALVWFELILFGFFYQAALAELPLENYLPFDGATNMSSEVELSVTLSAAAVSNATVTFYGHLCSTNAPGEDFTIVVLPDTQMYTQWWFPSIFRSQTEWIVNNHQRLNIVYVAHVGDIVQSGDGSSAEWGRATDALYRLESSAKTGLPEGIPYGVVPGNHDHIGGTSRYNTWFGVDHFLDRSYYGGHYGENNQNHYDLISVGGMDFVIVYLDYSSSGDVDYPPLDAWADSVLKANSNRMAIVVSHSIVDDDGEFSPRGQAIFDSLKGNPNLFLMLSGHYHSEQKREEVYEGRSITCCLSDYQDYLLWGGNGYLRLYEFSPSNSVIRVKTYSPYENKYETDSDSQFEIPFDMGNYPPFQRIGSTNIPPGGTAAVRWQELNPEAEYEWYATAGEGADAQRDSAVGFVTGPAGYQVSAAPIGRGSISPESAIVPISGNTNFVIIADAYHHISDVRTNGVGLGGAYGTETATQIWRSTWGEGTLTAVFSENLTSNGTPEIWLAAYGLTNSSFDAVAATDSDGDRLTAAEEYIAGTVPTNRTSAFGIEMFASDPVDGVSISWRSYESRTYGILSGTNLLDATSFVVISNGIVATPPSNTCSLGVLEDPAAFFQITVEKNP